MNNDNVVSFIKREYADIHVTYSYCRGNANVARRCSYTREDEFLLLEYALEFMQELLNGTAIPNHRTRGRHLEKNPDLEAQVLQEIKNNPQNSVRKVASQGRLPKTINS